MRVIFLGTGEIGLPTLEMLAEAGDVDLLAVVCQPDRPAGRKRELRIPDTKRFALDKGLAVLQPERIRSEDALESIRKLAPDLIIVMAYGQILPKGLLELPPLGCINLHASLLPRHRGAAPIQAAIAEGDSESGVTVMWMDEGLDTGDILLTKRLLLSPEETGESLHDRLAVLAKEATREMLDLFARGEEMPRVPQPSQGISHAGRLTRESARLDWNLPAADLERRIRAYYPWPVAWTEILWPDQTRQALQIHSAKVDQGCAAEPGGIRVVGGRLVIGAGEGALELLRVKLEGRKIMSAADFLRGHPAIGQATAQ